MIYGGQTLLGVMTQHMAASMNSTIFNAARFSYYAGDMNQSFEATVSDNSEIDKIGEKEVDGQIVSIYMGMIVCGESACGDVSAPYNECCR